MGRLSHPSLRRLYRCWLVAVFLLWPLPVAAQLKAELALDEPAARSAEPGQDGGDDKKILDLDLEQLVNTPIVIPSMDMPVTSVAREESTVGRSPAAVFVITQEMIRRSGATSIPEALRMAPGVEVAHIDANKWAVSARGFNQRYANKLLVLIDGRTVYSPVFSGVHWDVQDVLLEDIERIEVIRGPGGTLWGANAVNGVISIITKNAQQTQGAYVTAGGGTQERVNDAVRYGGQIGEDFHWRVYGKHFERGPGFDPNGQAADDWRQGRLGFRADWDLQRDKSNTLTVQGDYYLGASGIRETMTIPSPPFSQSIAGNDDVTGGNLLSRFRHVDDEDSDWALQMYYDQFGRDSLIISQLVRTFDVDFQYRFPLGDRQHITCGAGFRHVHDHLPSSNDFVVHFTPPDRTTNLASQFIQDEIELVEERLGLTMGIKLEENAFTGFAWQPSARLLWTPDRRHSAWGAISRAVHTPARTDDDFSVTASPGPSGLFPRITGSRDMRSETLWAYEVGYRAQAGERFSWDIAGFYNVYDDLKTLAAQRPFLERVPPPPHMVLPLVFTNGPGADTYGVELAANWTVFERWRVYGQYTFFHLHMRDAESDDHEGLDPHHQVYLRSSWDLRQDLEFDVMARYVDSLPAIDVPSYISMDLRLGWRPRKDLEMAVVGQNLLQSHHLERNRTGGEQVTEVPRGVYGTLTWRR